MYSWRTLEHLGCRELHLVDVGNQRNSPKGLDRDADSKKISHLVAQKDTSLAL